MNPAAHGPVFEQRGLGRTLDIEHVLQQIDPKTLRLLLLVATALPPLDELQHPRTTFKNTHGLIIPRHPRARVFRHVSVEENPSDDGPFRSRFLNGTGAGPRSFRIGFCPIPHRFSCGNMVVNAPCSRCERQEGKPKMNDENAAVSLRENGRKPSRSGIPESGIASDASVDTLAQPVERFGLPGNPGPYGRQGLQTARAASISERPSAFRR